MTFDNKLPSVLGKVIVSCIAIIFGDSLINGFVWQIIGIDSKRYWHLTTHNE